VSVTVPDAALWALLAAAALGWAAFGLAWRSRKRARQAAREARSSKRSQATRYGQLTEQFAPLVDEWPFDPERFRFLGSPIDGVQFTDEAVYLVEVKAGGSRRSAVQGTVLEQVREGRVGWLEVRVGEGGGAEVVEPWRARG
jgi:predicted Holliday junction resolvase-like endonuclease